MNPANLVLNLFSAYRYCSFQRSFRNALVWAVYNSWM